MKILFVSNEVAPLAKVGGLADVAGSLPVALAERGVDVRVAMPLHRSCLAHGPFRQVADAMPVALGALTLEAQVLEGSLGNGEVPLYLIKYDPFFDRPEVYGEGGTDYPDAAERYAFFSSAALSIPETVGFDPDVLHPSDWMAGLLPLFAERFEPVRPTLYTIHNLGYQGQYREDRANSVGVLYDADARHGGFLNFMAAGIRRATLLNTVSERYAQEIQTPAFGHGLEGVLRGRAVDLHGVVNGIDTDVWDPATDGRIAANFDAEDLRGKAECKAALQRALGLLVDPSIPVLGCVSRLAYQKGLDVLAEAIADAVALPMQVVLLGIGEADLERRFTGLAAAYPDSVAVRIAFSDSLARQVYAGSDLFAMPSRYEPCGLGQMISMAYGTVPVVSYTGGLADTVREVGDAPTGFVHRTVVIEDVVSAYRRAAEAFADRERWASIVSNCLAADFSWDDSARRYEELYKAAVARSER